MRILLSFLGAPGSGKGTQAELLARDYHFQHVVTGDMIRALRDKKDSGDPLATEVVKFYDRGIPQPDHIVNGLVMDQIEMIPKSMNLILDTYPLSVGQAETLEEFFHLHAREYREPYVVYFSLSEEESVKRLLIRKNKEHRIDDQENIIRIRYQEFAKRRDGLRGFYSPHNRFIEIDGSPSIDVCYQNLQQALLERHLLPV